MIKINVFYYEFYEAPYYALIAATNTFEALKLYDEEVSTIEYAEDVLPDELSAEDAFIKIANGRDIEGSDSESIIGRVMAGEITKESKATIKKRIAQGETCAYLLLVDGNLV